MHTSELVFSVFVHLPFVFLFSGIFLSKNRYFFILLLMEFMMLLFLFFIGVMTPMAFSFSSFMMFLMIMVVEGAFGLCVMMKYARIVGGDYFSSFTFF